ncbi:MAG: hypothetical protein K2K30_08420 [Alistipes sp.]|nr:hypothetical protein [Alistipes sp.]
MKRLIRMLAAALCLAAVVAGCSSDAAAGRVVPDRVLGVYRLYPDIAVPPPRCAGWL